MLRPTSCCRSGRCGRMAIAGAIGAASLCPRGPMTRPIRQANPLLYAVAWKQTAAEYRARLPSGLQHRPRPRGCGAGGAKSRTTSRWPYSPTWTIPCCCLALLVALIAQGRDFFDDPGSGTNGCRKTISVVAPGASDSLNTAREKGRGLFASPAAIRAKGPYALENLKGAWPAFADKEYLTVLTDSSTRNRGKRNWPKIHAHGLSGRQPQRLPAQIITSRRRAPAVLPRWRPTTRNSAVASSCSRTRPTRHWMAAVFGKAAEPPTRPGAQAARGGGNRHQALMRSAVRGVRCTPDGHFQPVPASARRGLAATG